MFAPELLVAGGIWGAHGWRHLKRSVTVACDLLHPGGVGVDRAAGEVDLPGSQTVSESMAEIPPDLPVWRDGDQPDDRGRLV